MKIMNYEEFKLELEKELPKASKNELAGLEISFSKLVCTNRMMDGIKISRKGEDKGIVINIQQLYEIYLPYYDFPYTLDTIIKQVKAYFLHEDRREKEEKLSKETAKVFIQLVNMEESKEMLQHVPHRQFLDLAIIYRIVCEETDQGFETGIVNNELMEALDWSEKDLYLKAMSQHIMKTKITLLDDVTCELLLKAGAPREFVDIMYPPEAESCPVYMLTNENMLFGANEILYRENLWKLSNKLHSDLYIIPSSIHECIVLPDDCSIHDVWRKQCHKNLQIKRKLLKLDGLPEGTRIQFPSLLSFSNGVEKGDSITLLKSNRKWIWEKYQYRFMKSYINPDYTILQKEEMK